MAKSPAQRQAEWIKRLSTKANLFDASNKARQERLAAEFKEPSCPEEAAVQRYFLNHPRCQYYPAVTYNDGRYNDAPAPSISGHFDEGHHLDSMVAFMLAVREVSSVDVFVTTAGDGSYGEYRDPYAFDVAKEIEAEAESLREAGLWAE